MTTNSEKSIACVACGGPVVQSGKGARKEFCSEICKKAGRAFCKACGAPLQQSGKGVRKVWCSPQCMMRYRRIGRVTPTYLEERSRSECIVCGGPISQTRYRPKKFCSQRCTNRYFRTGQTKQALNEEWGIYGPETRKVLREVQFHMGIGAAKRLATAIDREYRRR